MPFKASRICLHLFAHLCPRKKRSGGCNLACENLWKLVKTCENLWKHEGIIFESCSEGFGGLSDGRMFRIPQPCSNWLSTSLHLVQICNISIENWSWLIWLVHVNKMLGPRYVWFSILLGLWSTAFLSRQGTMEILERRLISYISYISYRIRRIRT